MAPETLEFLANAGASAATGGVVIALTNPLDCLKQRVQVRAAGPALLAHSSRIVATEGLWRGLWLPGLATNIAACTCSVGTRLGLYARVRDFWTAQLGGERGDKRADVLFLAGLTGGALGYLAAAPLFMASRVAHANAELARAGRASVDVGLATLARLARGGEAGGWRALWAGSPVLVARGALMSATQLASYDATKSAAIARGYEDGPRLHAAASFVARRAPRACARAPPRASARAISHTLLSLSLV